MAGWFDTLPPEATVNEFSAITYLVQAMLSRVRTVTLVKVVGITNDGAAAPIGTVDIQPLVNLMDGNRQATQHGTIYKCPYLRIGGGSNALIIDPQIGDIGIAAFADRDIQSAIANQGPANPGSARMFDWADGLYLSTVISGMPGQYIRISAGQIENKAPVTRVTDSLRVANGATGTFGTPTGQVVTVMNGIVTNIF